MPHDAHHVGLLALCVDGVTHGFAVDGKTLIALPEGGIPALQRVVQGFRIHTNEHIANDRFARHEVVAVVIAPATKAR